MQAERPDPRRGPDDAVAPLDLRVSDLDRHRVAEILRQAAGEGRLELDELDQRLEATFQAKTYGDLVPITVDLPAVPEAPNVPPAASVPVRWSSSVAVMSTIRRSGPWIIQDRHSAVAVMGTVVLDLRGAHFETREVTVHANALMGEVRVIVDARTSVVVDGFAVMGEYSEQRPKVPFDPVGGGPVLRLRGLALMGAVRVQRKGPPGEPMLRRLGRRRP